MFSSEIKVKDQIAILVLRSARINVYSDHPRAKSTGISQKEFNYKCIENVF